MPFPSLLLIHSHLFSGIAVTLQKCNVTWITLIQYCIIIRMGEEVVDTFEMKVHRYVALLFLEVCENVNYKLH